MKKKKERYEIQRRNWKAGGISDERERILKLIEERIKIQREMLQKQPKNKKSIEWRIIGFQELIEKIKSQSKK